ncbi:hypothetical protein AX17_001315 [Amanita inopinata Kibby_2008]|nr:hypothetical protein AX17_001315 [Amanita inopinata Kibby_2008]
MDSDPSRLEKLILQCKSNDIDAKVDALTKLQALFKSNIQIDDPDTLINVFKTCLRTSNQLLTTATLSALPSLLPLLITRPMHSQSYSTSSTPSSPVVDAVTLRQALNAFLPAGGIIERLGDKEKLQLNARECLVVLGGLAFRLGSPSTLISRSTNGKGAETPLMIFERFLREAGLASKVWKVREQCISTLVHIRGSHPTFPLRPYLSLLVDCLEDTDAHVRDSARHSIVELFSGPAVTDAARADLKKEMSKKGVRKTIVDGVLMKLLSGTSVASNPQSHEGSDNGDTTGSKMEYVPPSIRLQGLQGRRPRVASQNANSKLGSHVKTSSQGSAKEMSSRPASRAAVVSPPPSATATSSDNPDVQPVFIASSRDLENEFVSMAKCFEGKETEHNWGLREHGITRVRGMLKGGAYQRFSDTFLAMLKDGFIQWSLKTVASLRTTVSTNTCSLYYEMAVTLGSAMDPFCDVLLINLLKMANFTKKIAAQQSQGVVTAIIANTSAQPRIVVPLLWNTLQEKNVQARTFVVNHLKQYIEVHGQRSKNSIESSGGLELLEKSIKKSLADANPLVKESARTAFWMFNEIWKEKGAVIMGSLDNTARKQLEKACPNPELVSLPPTTPKVTKKSSVAAAIAATRAKAKANATAPPLRHQARSNPYASSTRSDSPTSFQGSSMRPMSPLRMSTTTSPVTSKSRIISTTNPTIAHTTTTPAAPPLASSHSRTTSGGSKRALSPPSPQYSTSRRRISTPLTITSSPSHPSTIRRAMQTALPDSPTGSPSAILQAQRPAGGTTRKTPVPVPMRQSSIMPDGMDLQDESLLLAQTVPIPEGDTDSEDQSVNLMSFSTSFVQGAPVPQDNSLQLSLSPKSDISKPTATVSNALSSESIPDGIAGQPVVEDALRARAEQAESAAERLLELVEPEDEDTPTIPASLLVGGSNGHPIKSKPKQVPSSSAGVNVVPKTPMNRSAAILRQAALFKDSPAHNGRTTSLLDVLQSHKHETGWWAKRNMLLARRPAMQVAEGQQLNAELQRHITVLEGGDPDLITLQQLAFISLANRVADSSPSSSPVFDEPLSPSPFQASQSVPSLHADMWEKDKSFDRLFKALIQYLSTVKETEGIDYGLIVLWEVLENQAPLLEGREADLFSVLLRVRYCNTHEVLEATNMIRDHLTSRIEPVYGLTTMHASLRAFYSEAPATDNGETMKTTSYAFGLIALGKFILRLPAEIAEEELPRLRQTLIMALNDKTSLIVRESAAASIIAAQLVLRDETHLFALLDGLADDKKNLLTYLFDKHGVRGMSPSSRNGSPGMGKLEKEIKRLDTRMSTPLRSVPDLSKP